MSRTHPSPTPSTMLDQAAGAPLPAIRRLPVERSAMWLERGYRDFFAYPRIGLIYGLAYAAIGWLLVVQLGRVGLGWLVLPLAGGFLLVAPVGALGLYEVSRRREAGEPVTLADTFAAIGRNPQIVDMGLVLMLIFFAWIQLAMILFGLFFGNHPVGLDGVLGQVVLAPQGPAFLTVGTIVGGALAAVAFSVSVVSLPMLLDRQVSALDAIRTSLAVVWLNRKNMIGWAATLAVLGAAGLAAFFIGLAVTLPIAAHASWHAYRDLVD